MGFFRRLTNLFRQKSLNSNLERELSFHLAEKVDELVASGMTPDEARAAARRRFGNYGLQKERTLDMDIVGSLASIGQDIRYGFRMIRKSPVFTLVVLLSLSIGIGANATLFSLVDSLILRALPVPRPNDLIYLQWTARPNWLATSISGTTNYDPETKETSSTSLSFEMFRRFRKESKTLSDIFAFAPLYQITINAENRPDRVTGQFVSGNYFSALGVRSVVGRVLSDDDDARANPVAVISYRYWERRFERNPDVIGTPVVLNGLPLTIVGVTEKGFLGTQALGGESAAMDISIPLQLERQLPTFRRGPGITEPGTWWVRIMGRKKAGVHDDTVRAELEPIFLIAARDGWNAAPPTARRSSPPEPTMPRLSVASGRGGLRDELDSPYLLILPLAAIAIIVLLIVCTNLANLMLARSAARQSELTVRQALGGGRQRLVRQLLTESALLALMGGTLGVSLSSLGTKLLVQTLPDSGFYDLRTDASVVVFALIVSLVSGILMGIIPAFRVTAHNLNPGLKESSRTVVGTRNPLSQGLLVAQVALSIVLLVGAGLFAQTVWNLRNVDVGFNPNNTLILRANPKALKYSDSRVAAFYKDTLDKLASIPGVQEATLSDYPVVGRNGSTDTLNVDGELSDTPSSRRDVRILSIHPNFFQVLGAPIVAGRNFTDRDNGAGPKVALINEALAHRLFLSVNPVGARVGFGGPEHRSDIEIIGVVKNVSLRPSREPVPPAIFLPDSQGTPGTATFLIRVKNNPTDLVPAIREAARQVDSNIPLFDVRTLHEQIESGFIVERMFAGATGFFGAVALLLACIGLFGLMSYRVERRTNEIGVRIALGATRFDVVRLVMHQTLMVALLGAVIGCAGSYLAGKLLSSLPFLFGVNPNDPLAPAIAILLMICVAALAAYLPARRASRVDPAMALRCE